MDLTNLAWQWSPIPCLILFVHARRRKNLFYFLYDIISIVLDFSRKRRKICLHGNKKFMKLPWHTMVQSLTHYTVKKVIVFPVPSRDVNYQTLLGRE
jgi:hypothetical protein